MITRETYKAIKSMNREQLNSYLTGLINQAESDGYEKGITKASKVIVDRISNGVANAPGVGEKRYNQIMNSIREAMEATADEDNTADDRGQA